MSAQVAEYPHRVVEQALARACPNLHGGEVSGRLELARQLRVALRTIIEEAVEHHRPAGDIVKAITLLFERTEGLL